ncbi:family 43 glycosylhydrolase [Paenibacillus polygoni]|uniref:Family 43 glycosylhydrolase n=1 Tax=Paenibacillus polygoni TaxID=3050112 RepID=A0ABY8WX41_9BACL|nr:LamG-like jellyroll fold domain-containing protein [Paenibacillus polygoni]WIV17597.1 family 43 glycosylhydrolase [Paenibacillus polygoni]
MYPLFKRSKKAALLTTTLTVLLSVFGSTGAISVSEAKGANEQTSPVFQEASVHDPSVIKVDNTFYVFGSHLAAAKSTDLMSWNLIDSGVKDGNKLIPNVTEELKEALAWAQSDTLWAADVIQLEDGRFYMYYNACKGDSPRSALGVAVADNIEGPYKDEGILLKSGMWDEISEDGTIYDATKHPNVVDPDVFYDKNGKLWMVYGSYSGGIFILEMDPKTGKILPDQGYGEKLIGGNHSRIEGPYILYHPETDYYYMYLSYGGLDSVGGYNMRVVRSKNPDGPYLDAEGNDMTEVKADPSLPLFDDRSIEPFGVKLMGNFQFTREIGDPGSGSGLGYVSPGHNSAYYDEKTGKSFLIFHSRFPNQGEGHEIRVHEMYMNQDGWPVVAPYRYTDQEFKKNINANDVQGTYQIINHGKEITNAIKTPSKAVFDKKGKITGDVKGTWSLGKNGEAVVNVDGTQYKGVFSREWDSSKEQTVMTFTTLSNQGVALWGSRTEERKDKDVVAAVKKDLSIGDTTSVYQDLVLPVKASEDSTISWTSSNKEVVSNTGVVKRPIAGKGQATVQLVAKIQKGKVTGTKTFNVTVLPELTGPVIANYNFDDVQGTKVSDQSVNGLNGVLQGGATQLTSGKKGAALQFNGKDGYVQVPGLVTDAQDFTFAAWVKWNGGGDWQRIFDFGNGLGKHMFLTPSQHTGVLQFTIHNGVDQSLLSQAKLPQNEWTHVAVTLEGNTGTMYVNGQPVATNKEMTYNPKDLLANEAYLGKSRFAADPYFNGSLDEVSIYNQALSKEDIQSLFSK